MNKQRRESLRKISSSLSECKNGLESIRDEEQECHDNLSDNLQESYRAQLMDEAVEYMDNAVEYVENAMDNVEKAVKEIDNATGC
jgi:prefoldin subunit 5